MAPSGNGRPALGKMGTAFVTLKLGPDARIFSLHKDLLCSQSPYFRAAFSESWKEGRENAIALAEADANAFGDLIMDWLYTGRWAAASDETLTRAYVFADVYDIPALREVIMREFFRMYTSEKYLSALPEYSVVREAFNCLPETSRLCAFFVDVYGARWIPIFDNEDERKEREMLPTSFLLPFIDRLGKRAAGNRMRKLPDLSNYLEQAEEGDEE